MEKNGISLDIMKLNELIDKITPQIEETKKEIFKLSNKEINLKSPKQVSELLFQDLKIPMSKLKKTKTKQIST
ncbi:MAG: DNA polymerase, partial [Candidatus Pacebacteria bacterium]|nr:DNA polymerase [Candidatus Paceibacterota bacterium]